MRKLFRQSRDIRYRTRHVSVLRVMKLSLSFFFFFHYFSYSFHKSPIISNFRPVGDDELTRHLERIKIDLIYLICSYYKRQLRGRNLQLKARLSNVLNRTELCANLKLKVQGRRRINSNSDIKVRFD